MRLSPTSGFFWFSVYMLVLILLPGGSISGLNVKILIFLPLVFLAIGRVLLQSDALYQLSVAAGLLALLLGWIFLAQYYAFYNVGLSLLQYRDVVTTFAGCWFVRLFTIDTKDRVRFIRLCLFAVAFGGLLKLAIFVYSFETGVPVSAIMEQISHAFGVQLMTFEAGNTSIRIQYPSDTMIPVSLFAILCLRPRLRIGGFASFTIVALLLVSSLLTFSRFIWVYTVLGVLLGLFAAKRDRMHLLYLGAATAAVAYSFDVLSTLTTLRFSSDVAESSDAERTLQKVALGKFFQDAPLFGHGLGTFTTQVIREIDLPYNYEMQLVALAGQIGLIGLLLLVGILVNYYRKAFTFAHGSRRFQFAVLGMLLCFLSAGFFNPYLVSSIAAATFGLLFALASLRVPETEPANEAASGLPVQG